jgi:hypothetical protein
MDGWLAASAVERRNHHVGVDLRQRPFNRRQIEPFHGLIVVARRDTVKTSEVAGIADLDDDLAHRRRRVRAGMLGQGLKRRHKLDLAEFRPRVHAGGIEAERALEIGDGRVGPALDTCPTADSNGLVSVGELRYPAISKISFEPKPLMKHDEACLPVTVSRQFPGDRYFGGNDSNLLAVSEAEKWQFAGRAAARDRYSAA